MNDSNFCHSLGFILFELRSLIAFWTSNFIKRLKKNDLIWSTHFIISFLFCYVLTCCPQNHWYIIGFCSVAVFFSRVGQCWCILFEIVFINSANVRFSFSKLAVFVFPCVFIYHIIYVRHAILFKRSYQFTRDNWFVLFVFWLTLDFILWLCGVLPIQKNTIIVASRLSP